jgi:hypothetical protein
MEAMSESERYENGNLPRELPLYIGNIAVEET